MADSGKRTSGAITQGASRAPAAARDGDLIDIPGRELRVLVPESEIKTRLENWTPPPPRYPHGVLAKYARLVSSSSAGAVTE